MTENHVHIGTVNNTPTSHNSLIKVDQLNAWLDDITAKPYVAPILGVQAVRAVLEANGIILPLLDIDGADLNTSEAGMLGYTENGAPAPITAQEGEYVYKIEHEKVAGLGHDPSQPATVVETEGRYFYLVITKSDNGLYDVWAQVVTSDELDALDEEGDDSEFDEVADSVNGPSEFLKRTRRSNDDSGNTAEYA